MAKKKSKSRPQEALRLKLEEIYPNAYVSEEIYVNELIEEQGYTVEEITRELGHKPHRLFVDIMMRDTDRTIAFEYHGEQHYSVVGNMTKNTADLMVSQMRDQEKSWILERIGIPLVAVPFDMYVDEAVIENLIEEAYITLDAAHAVLSECPECGRAFPAAQLPNGLCDRCWHKVYADEIEKKKRQSDNRYSAAQEEYREQQKAKRKELAEKRKEEARKRREERKEALKAAKAREREEWRGDGNSDTDDADVAADEYSDGYDDYDAPADDWAPDYVDEYKEQQKERAKQARKEAYQRYKESPQFQEQKERAKQARKEAYRKRKEYAKKHKR